VARASVVVARAGVVERPWDERERGRRDAATRREATRSRAAAAVVVVVVVVVVAARAHRSSDAMAIGTRDWF
jgi:hypothetical protein